jgi:hypothetical protein
VWCEGALGFRIVFYSLVLHSRNVIEAQDVARVEARSQDVAQVEAPSESPYTCNK